MNIHIVVTRTKMGVDIAKVYATKELANAYMDKQIELKMVFPDEISVREYAIDETVMLTTKKAEELFYFALCDGLSEIARSGIDILCNSDDYKEAKCNLQLQGHSQEEKEESICREDIFMELLRMGKTIDVVDSEDLKSAQNVTIGIKEVHERVGNTPMRHLTDAINETGDVITADVILQTVFFGEIIFG